MVRSSNTRRQHGRFVIAGVRGQGVSVAYCELGRFLARETGSHADTRGWPANRAERGRRHDWKTDARNGGSSARHYRADRRLLDRSAEEYRSVRCLSHARRRDLDANGQENRRLCAERWDGGIARGTAERLRQRGKKIAIIAVEPAESPVLSGGTPGSHKIDGIGAGFVVPLWRNDIADRIERVSTEEAMAMAFRLAREEGLFAGTSTGCNVIAALRLAEELGPGSTVVTIMCDSGMKYLKTYGAVMEKTNAALVPATIS